VNDSDIENALDGIFLAANLSGLTLLFSNATPAVNPPVRPYAFIEVMLDEALDDTLAATRRRVQGRISALVVIDEGGGKQPATVLCDQIVALFPMGRRIICPGAKIEIRKPPSKKPGYAQGGAWRTPLIISFEATATS
jgi:hypothetical protein